MSTLETPEQTSPEPIWSLATALLFVALWVVLLILIQLVFLKFAAVVRGLRFEDMVTSIQNDVGSASQAVLSAGTVTLSWMATFMLLARLLRRYPGPLIRKALGLEPPARRWTYALGIPVGLGLLGAGMVLMHLLNVSEDETPLGELLKTPLGAAAVGFMALAIAPVAEEVFFRGFVFPPMARRFSLGTAMAFNGAVFAAVHLMTYGQEFGYLPPLFLFGFVLSGLRAWTGSVGPGIVAHFVFNATSLFLFLIAEPPLPS